MREIKFRCWRGTHYKDAPFTLEAIACNVDDIGDNLTYDKTLVWEQFTGLKDKAGKEIFEGDIIQDNGGNPEHISYMSKVIFHKGRFCGDMRPFGEGPFINISEHTEVIGNIHSTPELLK